MVIDLHNVLWYLESEEEFYDAPCSPLEEYFQSTASVKSCQQNKLPELDSSKNMIQYKIRFEVPEVCTIVKLIFVSYFYSQLIYIMLLLTGSVYTESRCYCVVLSCLCVCIYVCLCAYKIIPKF